jgi:uncharacterized surface protein with fasciclin (FAS1) repeats
MVRGVFGGLVKRADVQVIETDIDASNGVIHKLDGVLLSTPH